MPVPGAVITWNAVVVAESDGAGKFALMVSTEEGVLEVSAPGFQPYKGAMRVWGADTEFVVRLEPTSQQFQTIVRTDERPSTSRFTVSSHEARQIPGVLGDPLRTTLLMPGAAPMMSGLPYPIVRGAQPAATAYFIDGVRIPILFHMLVGPSVVHPEFIETIDFYRSVPPVEFGRMLGGVVSASAARPADARFRASAYADLLNAGAHLQVPLVASETQLVLSGRVSYTPWLFGLASSSSGPFGQKVIADFYDYQVRVEQRLGPGRLRLLVLESSDRAGLDRTEEAAPDVLARVAFRRADLRWRQALPVGEVEAAVTWGNDLSSVEAGSGAESHGSYSVASQIFGARVDYGVTVFPSLSLRVAADVQHQRANSEAQISANSEAEPSAFAAPEAISTFSGAFLGVDWKPLSQLTTALGMRVDYYHLVPGVRRLALEPRATAAGVVSAGLIVKAGVGLAHQPPTVLIALPMLDSAGLRYGLQEALNADIGAEWMVFPGLQLSANAYLSYLTRTHEFDLTSVLQEKRRKNIVGQDLPGWGRAYGIELMVRREFSLGLSGWASYSLSRSERLQRYPRLADDGSLVEWREELLPSVFDQTHVFNGTLSYRFANDLTVGVGVHARTGRPESGQLSSRTARLTDTVTGPLWRPVDRDQVDRLPPFLRVDVRVSKFWTLDDFRLEAYLDLQNASLSQEVLGFDYSFQYGGFGNEAPTPTKTPIGLPVVLPMLGVTGRY